ncbi:MAG: hypothetical protein WCR67_00295 [Bacilli bacterium]
MKKTIKRLFIILLGFLLPFSIIASLFVTIPCQYSETYVGELSYLFDRLNSTKERKVIVIGGSSCAFGLRSDLVEQELGLPCINFGLYGTIGTKTMMSLAKSNIQEGDIVILSPEVNEQTMSLYFNPDAMIRALNGNMEMFSLLDEKDQLSLLSAVPSYLSNNYDIYSGKASNSVAGIYQRSSFNEYGDISVFRPFNIMEDSYDPVSLIKCDFTSVPDDFIDYCNEFASFVRSKKASIYYSYGPMNQMAIASSVPSILEFEDYLYDKLDFEIISNINDYIIDSDYFYDTNFHLNTAGAILRTNSLIYDIKRVLGDNSPNNIQLMDKPLTPSDTDDGEDGEEEEDTADSESMEGLDNSYYDDFSYDKVGSYYSVTNLKGSGQAKSELVVPCLYEGKRINRITMDALSYAPNLKKITIQRNITQIQNSAFSGCPELREIYVKIANPVDITVGMAGGLLTGTNATCLIYVPKASLSLYQNDYTWEAYRSVLRGY